MADIVHDGRFSLIDRQINNYKYKNMLKWLKPWAYKTHNVS